MDKRIKEPDQFGYMSLHYVVSCNEQRKELLDFSRYQNLKFEIQIRSIFQHAWAEIEHDLGYKNKNGMPHQIKRNFNRISALLESADIQFGRLKVEVEQYNKELPKLITATPQKVDLSNDSMVAFVASNEILQKVVIRIERDLKRSLFEDQEYDGLIEVLKKFFDIKTIKELRDKIEFDKKLFIAFIEVFTKGNQSQYRVKKSVIYYFLHFLAAQTKSKTKVNKYLNFGGAKISIDADNLIACYKEVEEKFN